MVNKRRTILAALLGAILCLVGCQSGLNSFRGDRSDSGSSQHPASFHETAATVLNRHRQLTSKRPLRNVGRSPVRPARTSPPRHIRRTPQPIASRPLNLQAVPTAGQWNPFVDSEIDADAPSGGRQLKPAEFNEPSAASTDRVFQLPPPAPIPDAPDSSNDDSTPKTTWLIPLTPPAPLATMEADDRRPTDEIPAGRYPINLPTVLRLAGADNWGIQLATERVRESQSRLLAARVLWLPSLNAGLGYTKHDGRIQDTRGPVIDASRNSFFLGGGAGLGAAPLAGGGGGPARLMVDLSLADALFKPLAAKQRVRAAEANKTVTFNDTLLSASLAYYDLVGAQGQLAIARKNLNEARELLKLTKAFVAAGKGSQADTARVQVEVSNRRQIEVQADLAVKIASAELARVLQLDPEKLETGMLLYPLEGTPTAVELVGEDSTLDALITQGKSARSEVDRAQAELEARRTEVAAERWRPFIPNLYVGTSAGGFGGGVNDRLNGLDGRSDVDILAVWQLKNLGLGQRADRQEKSSRYRQALLDTYRLGDVITADVTKAYHQVHAQRERLRLAATTIDQAIISYRKNLLRIRGLEGLPLEAIQALQAVAEARRVYLATVVDYNRAQLRLLRAIGRPISSLRPVDAADQNG